MRDEFQFNGILWLSKSLTKDFFKELKTTQTLHVFSWNKTEAI